MLTTIGSDASILETFEWSWFQRSCFTFHSNFRFAQLLLQGLALFLPELLARATSFSETCRGFQFFFQTIEHCVSKWSSILSRQRSPLAYFLATSVHVPCLLAYPLSLFHKLDPEAWKQVAATEIYWKRFTTFMILDRSAFCCGLQYSCFLCLQVVGDFEIAEYVVMMVSQTVNQ